MRYLIVFLLLCSPAYAANCVLDKNNNVVSKINYTPDMKDLESRGEAIVNCSDDIVIGDADFRNNKIVKHVPTQDEIKAKKKSDDDAQDLAVAKASGMAKLKALGLSDNEINSLVH